MFTPIKLPGMSDTFVYHLTLNGWWNDRLKKYG